jgi:hypothetical protein
MNETTENKLLKFIQTNDIENIKLLQQLKPSFEEIKQPLINRKVENEYLLCKAIKESTPTVVQTLLKFRSINLKDSRPLHLCCELGKIEILKLILNEIKNSINLKSIINNENNIIIYCIEKSLDLKCFKKILKFINSKNEINNLINEKIKLKSPIHYAIENENIKYLELIIKYFNKNINLINIVQLNLA